MSSQMNTKVRLVRCPRCRQVLPELADAPVYRCGGCGTILQAKKRKNDTKDTGSRFHETDPAQKKELQHVSEDKEAAGLSQRATLPSTGEPALGKSSGRAQNEFGDCNREQPGGIYLSDEHSSSTELTHYENEESSAEARAHTEVDEDKCSLVQNHGKGQNKFGDCNREWSGGINLSDELSSSTELTHHKIEDSSPEALHSSSTELTHHENEDSSPEARTHTGVDEDKCSLDQNNGKGQNEFGDCNREWSGGIKLSDEHSSSTELTHHENEDSSPEAVHSSSTELTHHENEDSSPEARAHTEVDEDKCSLDQNNGRGQNEFGDCNRERSGGMNFSEEVSLSNELIFHETVTNFSGNEELSPIAGAHIEVDDNKYSLEQNNGRDPNESEKSNGEWPIKEIFSNEVPSSTELSCHEIEEPSPVSGEDENFKSRFIFRSSSAENFLATRPRESTITSQRPLGESTSSDNLTSPYNEQLEQSRKSVLHGFDRVSSVDTLENTLVNPSSELGVTLRDMSKSPTTRSYYAYDGSVSSYDGTDDQVPDQHLHLSERNFKDADFVNTKGMPRMDEFKVNNMMRSDLELHHQARNSSSISSEKKHYAMKSSKWRRDDLLEPTTHGDQVRSRMRLESDERLSRLPFYSRGSQADYENGSPSSYRHKEFQRSSSFQPPDKPEYPEQDRLELLRMVYELQDQLNRTYISKGKANGRFPAEVAWKEMQIPSYYGHVAQDAEIYHDLNYPRYPGRCSRGKSWSQQFKMSGMPFSGEATNSRHQVEYSCLHCCPQDWHCSAQLPPCVVCCNKGQYTAHPSHKCYNLYRSTPSSPQHFTGSEFSLWSRDTKSDDQWHKDHEVRKYLRERRHMLKRHFRPVAGGAPIIACYHCLELLQLPADFLLCRKRCHRLRCSACSKVLKFSLQSRTHIVPYTRGAIAPPPSEVDDHSDAISRRKFASAFHAHPHADPVSCSDDYGLSFCKSYSTEGEPFSLAPPFPVLERNSNDRKMSSGSSFERMEERKKKPILKQSQNKNKNPVESFESAGPSSKMSKPEKLFSEIEELPPTTGSPLHRLMGYSSPSQVLNR